MNILPKQKILTSSSSLASLEITGKIAHIGIQAPANTSFKINNGTNMIIGATGIFELELPEGYYLDSLKFNALPTGSNSYIVDYIDLGGAQL